MNFFFSSSIVNEAIRAVLSLFIYFFFFLQEDFTHTKSVKSTKSIKSVKSTKKHKKRKKSKKCKKRKKYKKPKKRKERKKHKTSNKRLSSSQMFFMRIKMLSFLFLFACMIFVLFVCVKSSCKKKMKRFKIALIASFTILLLFPFALKKQSQKSRTKKYVHKPLRQTFPQQNQEL